MAKVYMNIEAKKIAAVLKAIPACLLSVDMERYEIIAFNASNDNYHNIGEVCNLEYDSKDLIHGLRYNGDVNCSWFKELANVVKPHIEVTRVVGKSQEMGVVMELLS